MSAQDQAQIIRWEEPPPTNAKGGRGFGSASSQWAEVAKLLTANVGRWALLKECTSVHSAGSLAGRVREGRVLCFAPRGDFEACTRAVDGQYRVYARYLGDGPL